MQPIELYSMATPNGQKVGIALEEMELPYNAHLIDILKGDQHKPQFLAINPNGKIPAIVDPQGDNGRPLTIFESGAILLHLAKISGKFLPDSPRGHSETLQWLFFQVGGVGPMFGQFGHFFKYVPQKNETGSLDHTYSLERYKAETKRLLSVLDKHLDQRAFLVAEQYTIADMAVMPWVNGLSVFYKADDVLELTSFKNLERWKKTLLDRPQTQKGLKVTSFS